MVVMFWNVNRNNCDAYIASLVQEYDVSVVVLAENSSREEETLVHLKSHADSHFHAPPATTKRIQFFIRHGTLDLSEKYGEEGGRLTIRKLHWEGQYFLLAAVHLRSKLHFSNESQSFETIEFHRKIREYEDSEGHQRSIVVGDFNMNPFEPGMIAAAGLNSAMTIQTAQSGQRIVQGKAYNYFYNPMWSLFGDRNHGPSGTYYYRSSDHISYDWNMFDQVLLRPEVAGYLQHLEIVTKTDLISLADANGIPSSGVASDHFPIIFSLSK
jgi:hypothetical protein